MTRRKVGKKVQDLETGHGKSFTDASNNSKDHGSTSDSSTEKVQNYNLDDDEDDCNDEAKADADMGDSVMATGETGIDSILSPRDSMLEEPGMTAPSNSVETDVCLNRDDDDMIVAIPQQKGRMAPYSPESTHRRPDFLDMCCAGDPLQMEQHLDEPTKTKTVTMA
jgi:hypothetical protein